MTPAEFDLLPTNIKLIDRDRIRAALIRLENGDYHAGRVAADDRHWRREFAAAALTGLLARSRFDSSMWDHGSDALSLGEFMLAEAKRREGSEDGK